ncbi:autotransporter domain-containing protein, partial [Siccirubricoccus sp. KC 17139]
SGSGAVVLGAKPLTIANGSTSFAGGISGNGGLTVAGGTQTLAGLNTYTGSTTINGGATLALSGTGSIAASAGLVNDGTFRIADTSAGASITTLSGSGGVELGARTLTLTNAAGSFFGAISGSGGFALAGGTQSLTGTSSYAGGTSIANATLIIASDAAMGGAEGGLAITNGRLVAPQGLVSARSVSLAGTGTFDTAMRTISLSGTISGSGGLVADGGGTLALTGTNTYAGGTLVIGGTTLAIGSDSALGASSGALVVRNGTLLATSSFSLDRTVVIETQGHVDTSGHAVSLGGNVYQVSADGQTATSVFTGSATLTGSLILDATGLVVLGDSTLHGTGTITTPTTVRGTLSPGDSPGTITFTESLVLDPGATLALDIDGTGTGNGAGNFDRVLVTGGSFTAGGTLAPRLRGITGDANNSYTPPVGQAFTVVQASGGVQGSFSGLAQPTGGLLPGSRFDALYTATALTLYVTPESYAGLGALGLAQTPNQTQVGLGLDALRPLPGLRTDAERTATLGILFALPAEALPATMDRLSGTIYGDAIRGSLTASGQFGTAVADQAAARRGHGRGIGNQASTPDGRLTLWAAGLGGSQRVSATGNTASNSSGGGFAGGAALRLDAGTEVGAAIGYSGMRISSGSTGGKADLDMVHAALQGSWTNADLWADAQFGGSVSDTSVHRNLGAFRTIARGQASGLGVHGAVAFGTRHEVGSWHLLPSVGLRVDSQSRDTVREKDAGVLNLAIRSATGTSTRALLGLRAGTSVALGEGWQLAPSAKLFYAREFGDADFTTLSSFQGAAGTPMRAQTAKVGRDGAILGLGMDLRMPGGGTAFVAYAGDLRAHQTDHSVTVGVSYSW